MRFEIKLLALCFALAGVSAEVDKCPKDEYACLDVINSSLCISQNAASGTAAALAECVTYTGAASSLPGATKLCRCPGCHSASINAAISRLFPTPCN
ncbi:hypothetical protein BJ875DRAFT_481086 [Amylocarpus encephaloides]|uniref:Fungal calcium binding protein domain-containing protein n=1 Tax=Amylocarpus encephaloides TaxID=45428 RepID=A0A9P7YQ86_9HELO|nr:hypothetical protein BJ875DRAFT_481086 [Amylocarpus encephaloides]